MPYELKGGEKVIAGVLYGWTGRDCQKCKGTGEDFSDVNAPYVRCGSCGGTGEEWGVMPVQPGDLSDVI